MADKVKLKKISNDERDAFVLDKIQYNSSNNTLSIYSSLDPTIKEETSIVISNVEVDTTLTESGKAADSKTVGDAIDDLDGRLTIIEREEAETVDLFLGSTPQTLSSNTHTKLTTASTATYTINELIADYERNNGVTYNNVTLTIQNDKMVFTATGDVWNDCYVDILINELDINQQYNLVVNKGQYISGTTGGHYRIYDSSMNYIDSFDANTGIESFPFTATTSTIIIRIIPVLQYYWETYNLRTATIIGLKVESERSDSFDGEIDLGILTTDTVISSSPESQVYAVLKNDEISRTLIGYTPLTVDDETNIELSSPQSTQYTISNLFVLDYDTAEDVRLYNTTFTRSGDKMIFTATSETWGDCFIDIVYEDFIIGQQYTFTVNRGEYIRGTTGGNYTIYDNNGDSLGNMDVSTNTQSISFTATTTKARIRFRIANYYWETYDMRTITIVGIELTTQISGTFNGSIDLGRLPIDVVITTVPICQVYSVYPKEDIRVDTSLNPNSRNPVQNRVIVEAMGSLSNLQTSSKDNLVSAINEAASSASHLIGQTCVCLGDSVMAFRTPPEDIPSIIAQRTGMTVYNCAFGGCRISDNTIPQGEEDPWEAFCFARLSDGIVSGDWSYQEANIDRLQELDYDGYSPSDHFATLKDVDWDNVNILVINFAGNDPGNVRFDDPQDDDNTYYYLGAFRYGIRKILTEYPHLKILVVGTDYHKSGDSNTDDRIYTIDGQTYHYYDWSDALMEECKKFKIPTLDWYRSNGLNALTLDYYMTSDKVHPNYIGNQLLANQISGRLLSLY